MKSKAMFVLGGTLALRDRNQNTLQETEIGVLVQKTLGLPGKSAIAFC
jgi:hypothetical protein